MPARDDFEPLHSASNSRRTRLQSRGAMVEWVVVDMVELDPTWAMGRCRYGGARSNMGNGSLSISWGHGNPSMSILCA